MARTLKITANNGPDDLSIPCILVSDVDNAVGMRFGNTYAEMLASSVKPYSQQYCWYLRGESTGDGLDHTFPMTSKSVWGEYTLDDSQIITIEAIEPPRTPVAPANLLYPPIYSYRDNRASDFIFQQFFYDWPERWVTYMDVPNRGNIWFPLTHERASDSVFTDDSRWRVDAPETPNSMLIMLVYWKWLVRQDIVVSRDPTINLANKRVYYSLKGLNLDMKGGNCYFWIETAAGRWHKTATPVIPGVGVYNGSSVDLTTNPADWTRTYDRYQTNPPLNLASVTSFGFSFIGFPRDNPCTGQLHMDYFAIKSV